MRKHSLHKQGAMKVMLVPISKSGTTMETEYYGGLEVGTKRCSHCQPNHLLCYRAFLCFADLTVKEGKI